MSITKTTGDQYTLSELDAPIVATWNENKYTLQDQNNGTYSTSIADLSIGSLVIETNFEANPFIHYNVIDINTLPSIVNSTANSTTEELSITWSSDFGIDFLNSFRNSETSLQITNLICGENRYDFDLLNPKTTLSDTNNVGNSLVTKVRYRDILNAVAGSDIGSVTACVLYSNLIFNGSVGPTQSTIEDAYQVEIDDSYGNTPSDSHTVKYILPNIPTEL